VEAFRAEDFTNIFQSWQSVLTNLKIRHGENMRGNFEQLEAAIQNNDTIQSIKLHESTNNVMEPFLIGLKSNMTVKHFHINLGLFLAPIDVHEDEPEEFLEYLRVTESALLELLSCTTVDKLTIANLELDIQYLEELAKNEVPTDIELVGSCFSAGVNQDFTHDTESYQQFFQKKANLHRLYLDPREVMENPGIPQALCQALIRMDSSLCCVEFGVEYGGSSNFFALENTLD